MSTNTDPTTDQWIEDNLDKWLSQRLPNPSAREILESLNGNLNEWVYQGIVCDSYTMIVGAPKQGKSLIAVNIAAAYSRGEPFLDISPATGNEPKNVLIITTEANGDKENVRRLNDINADMDRVFINKVGSRGIPEEAYGAAEAGNIGLVIIDNVIGLCRGVDINKPEAVTAISNATERFNLAGVPVVFIHHTSKGTGNNPVNSSMGNAGIAGLMRHLVGVTRHKDVTTLSTNGNLESSTFKVKFDDKGKASLVDSGDGDTSPNRDTKTYDSNKQIADLAVRSRATTATAAAKFIAANSKHNETSLSKRILPELTKSGLLNKEQGRPYAYGVKYRG